MNLPLCSSNTRISRFPCLKPVTNQVNDLLETGFSNLISHGKYPAKRVPKKVGGREGENKTYKTRH